MLCVWGVGWDWGVCEYAHVSAHLYDSSFPIASTPFRTLEHSKVGTGHCGLQPLRKRWGASGRRCPGRGAACFPSPSHLTDTQAEAERA